MYPQWPMLPCGLPPRLPRARRRRRLRRSSKRPIRLRRSKRTLVPVMARRSGCPFPMCPAQSSTPRFRPLVLAEVAVSHEVEGRLVATVPTAPLPLSRRPLRTKPPRVLPSRRLPSRTLAVPTLSLRNDPTARRLLPVPPTRARALTGAVVPRERTTQTLASKSTETHSLVMPRASRGTTSLPTRATGLLCPLIPRPATV